LFAKAAHLSHVPVTKSQHQEKNYFLRDRPTCPFKTLNRVALAADHCMTLAIVRQFSASRPLDRCTAKSIDVAYEASPVRFEQFQIGD
jgi:hypothetical protein